MPKLITSQQYEPALAELNALRPLQLQERICQRLNVPILNKLPKESTKSATGTFAVGVHNGLLVNNITHIFKNVEHKQYVKGSAPESWYVVFSQRVYHVVTKVTYETMCNYLRWVTPAPAKIIKDLPVDEAGYCEFVGTIMFFAIDPVIPNECIVDVYGFY